MPKLWSPTFVLTLLLAGIGTAHAAGVLEVQGKGVQIYRCAPAGDAFKWTLKGPDATLSTADGAVIGHHFAGPSWQAADGSTVVGEAVTAADAPAIPGQTPAVPWLVLRAKSHAGAGTFAAATYVVRTRTEGGAASATGCDAAHSEAETSIPYSATYTLFGVQ